MKKTILSLLLLCSSLMAEVTNIDVTPEFIEENKIKIIDIRTESEWEEMGVVSGAHLITFFTKNNKFHSESFLKELNLVVDKNEQFAIISNTASRTKLVSNFLGHKHNYNVINLIGGMSKLLKEGYKVEVYKPKKSKEEIKIKEEREQEDNNTTIK
ncbi:MAG TPA: rhodanese-like domain-containing protein [Campylobacterales bacterium]|nr:rhodanese-like domain-containing protein [Campylobacterales bacterium]